MDSTIEKVREMRKYYDEIGREDISIEVDGNMSIENAEIFYELGADTFVSGSSCLFKNSEKPVKDVIGEQRKVIGWK